MTPQTNASHAAGEQTLEQAVLRELTPLAAVAPAAAARSTVDLRPPLRERFADASTRPLAPVVAWLAVAITSLGADHVGMPLAWIVGASGVVLMLLMPRLGPSVRLLLAVALLPAVFVAQAPTVAWVLAGTLIAALAATRERPHLSSTQDLQRHLDWCRRREEEAEVLVMRLPSRAVDDARALMESFRLTDNVMLRRRSGICEVHAVLDSHELSRAGLQRRVVADVGPAEFGWATFPHDGLTLAVLLEQAANRLPSIVAARACCLSDVSAGRQDNLPARLTGRHAAAVQATASVPHTGDDAQSSESFRGTA